MTWNEIWAWIKGCAFLIGVMACAVAVGLLGGVFLSGCGPRAVTIQHQYVATKDRCLAVAHQIEAECPHGDECVARLLAHDQACRREFAAICSQRRAPESCQ